MVQISDHDVRTLNERIGHLYAQKDLQSLCWSVIESLESMVDCDWASISLSPTPSAPKASARFWSVAQDLQFSLVDRYAEFYQHHPMWQLWCSTLKPGANELADIMSVQDLHRSPIQREIFTPLAIGNMMGVCCPNQTPFAIVVIREKRRLFTARDRLIVECLTDQVAAASRHLALTTMLDADDSYAGFGGLGFIGLDSNDAPRAVSPGCLELLWRIYPEARGSRAIPAPVKRWLDGHTSAPFRETRGGFELIIAPPSQRGDFAKLLTIELRAHRANGQNGAASPAPESGGHGTSAVNGLNGHVLESSNGATRAIASLTPRQREIAHWIAAGKTNPEIAIILGLSPRTVQKHVENIFTKFGVHTRTGLVAEMMRG